MPFNPETQNPGDLVKSQDWNDAMKAIVQLFEKFSQASGHQHTGAVEDAPPIQQNGLADNAVAESKIQNNAVTTNKIRDGAVTEAKLANLAVSINKLQDNSVAEAKLQNNAVSTNKIRDGAITASKIAAGVIPGNIGIAVTPSLSNGQTIPIPAGFTKQECVFFAFMKFLNIPSGGGTFQCLANNEGVVTLSAPQGGGVSAVGVAIGKKGGW